MWKRWNGNMGSSLWKDFFREIKKSFSRFISIFTIVFIGVGFFAGVKSTAPNMKKSMDSYYDEYNLMDIRIMSTLGLTEDDISAIEKIDGVLGVQAGYFTDVVTTVNSNELVLKVHSMPSKIKSGDKDDIINAVKLIEGRYPEKSGECIIEESIFIDYGFSIGDTIKVGSGKEVETTKDTLVTDKYTIVGKAITPYYLSYEKGSSEIGSGTVNSYIMVLEEDFKIPVYTEALVTVKDAKALNSYNKEYKECVTKVVTALENLGFDRSGIRLEEIKKMAKEELDKATKEYNEQKNLYDKEIKKAEEELSNSLAKISEGEAKLATERKNFQENYEQGRKQIKEGEEKLAKGEAEYAQGAKELNEAKAKYGEDLEMLNNGTTTINARREEAEKEIESLKKRLEDPNLSEEDKESTQALISSYEEFLKLTESGVESLNDFNNYAQGQVTGAEEELKAARRELDKAAAELASGKKQLAAGKREAETKFATAEKELAEGKVKYEEGKKTLEKEKTEGQKKLEEGKEKIIRAENEIEKLSEPQWYVLDRDSHYSFVDYGKTADRIDSIAKIFPVFFFLVAALVCLTTMTRMVDEQRGIIGTYKAFGYSNQAIASKYVLYAAIASILGGSFGLIFGLSVFPITLYKAWSMMYTLPPMETVRQVPLMVVSLLIGVLVTTLSALGACVKELKEVPSLLMRPKAPKAGKKIFLERINFIWKRMSFSYKVTARNIFRYKKRFFMTIIGIAGCTALLLAGFGLSDSISQVVNKQYKEIFTYNLNMKFATGAEDEGKERVMNKLDENKNVKSYLASSQYNGKVKGDKDEIGLTLIIPTDMEKFTDYISLRDRNSHRKISIPKKGIVINEKLVKELNVKKGDAIEMDNGDGARRKVEIADITENYVFHYGYMSPEYYKEIYRLNPKVNSLMIKLKNPGASEESELGIVLIKDSDVASVEYYSAAADTFEDSVEVLNSIVILIIISAGLLAFVVLYNLTNINIGERIREIATIKVLGFYNREVSAYVYRENIILSLIGSIVGLFIGIILHRFIMVSIEQDGVMFGNHIDSISFLYSFIITMVFVILVDLFMYRKLKKIPMVESLKSVE